MYIGDRFDAMPIATPPAIRHVTNAGNDPAQPVSTDDPAKSSAAAISSFFRPNRSLSAPVTSEPIRQPTSAHEFAQPTSAARREAEALLEERLRAADDDPVVAEQQAAHGRDERDRPHVAEVVAGRHRYSATASNMAIRFSIGVIAWTL